MKVKKMNNYVGTTCSCGIGKKNNTTTLNVSRVREFIPKTEKSERAWDRTIIKHEGIHNWCCLPLRKAIENEWFEYNPETVKLSLFASEIDKYGNLMGGEFHDFNYCPFCGTKIEVNIIKDIEKHGKVKYDYEEQVIKVATNRRIEWTEKDLTEDGDN